MYDTDCADERMKVLIDNFVDNFFIPEMTEEQMREISAIKVDIPASVEYKPEELAELGLPARVRIAVDALVKLMPELASYEVADIWGYFQYRIQEACDYYDADEEDLW